MKDVIDQIPFLKKFDSASNSISSFINSSNNRIKFLQNNENNENSLNLLRIMDIRWFSNYCSILEY